MSEVYRYEFDENGVCYRKPDGPFVSHDDYAAIHYERIHDLNQIGGLQEENARLKTEVERLDDLVLATKQVIAQHEMFYATKWLEENFPKSCTESFQAENARLKAEVERLRKAGDAMADIIGFAMARTDGQDPKLVREWNAAKEGKPSV